MGVAPEHANAWFLADSAYRSQNNEKWLAAKMLVSRIHRKKSNGKTMLKRTAQANARKSSICAHVEHVFAHQKNRYGLFIRAIGIKRAEAKLILANFAKNTPFERGITTKTHVIDRNNAKLTVET